MGSIAGAGQRRTRLTSMGRSVPAS